MSRKRLVEVVQELRALGWSWEVGNTGSEENPAALLYLTKFVDIDEHYEAYETRLHQPTIEGVFRLGLDLIKRGSYDKLRHWPRIDRVRGGLKRIYGMLHELDRLEEDLEVREGY